MKIVLLGHDDAPSLYALDRLLKAMPEHDFDVFVSGSLPSADNPHPALAELDACDRSLCGLIEADAHPTLARRAPLPVPNAGAGLDTLRDAVPDLIVSVRYRRILKDAAIAVPPAGVLNLHSGILPDYRGVMATFWAMLADEREIGCTLHWITDAGIDTGPVIAICRQPRSSAASYLENVLALYGPGSDRLVEAVGLIAAGRPEAGESQPCGAEKYFPAPDTAAIDEFLAKNLKLVPGAEKPLIFGEKPDR